MVSKYRNGLAKGMHMLDMDIISADGKTVSKKLPIVEPASPTSPLAKANSARTIGYARDLPNLPQSGVSKDGGPEY